MYMYYLCVCVCTMYMYVNVQLCIYRMCCVCFIRCMCVFVWLCRMPTADPVEGGGLQDQSKEPNRDSGILEQEHETSILGNREISLLKDGATTRYTPHT